MSSKSLGGGSSAVAASAHAACARFRGTDPLVVGRTRRRLAVDIGFPDSSGQIPKARWVRAMAFERLVREPRFAGEVATTAVGRLGLDRPADVVMVDAQVSVDKTVALLVEAHARAMSDGAATLIYGLAVPFAGFEESRATVVKPDFAVVAPKTEGECGSWLVVGDAKDYERVRSRIEDTRLLKGFLQVALGAESAASWSRLPSGMTVHRHGVLAVPRNNTLEPEAVVDLLDDHRAEVRMRVAERRREAERAPYAAGMDISQFVAHLHATFDPATCRTCTLFSYCRNELRTSNDPTDLLIELGIPAGLRPQVAGLVGGDREVRGASASVAAQVAATLDGVGRRTGQWRIDQAGQVGTVNVVIAKSDAAALGVHGIALQPHPAQGRAGWQVVVFDDPQSQQTRRDVMRLLGQALTTVMTGQRGDEEPRSVHLVVPDKMTADLLVSIADNLAGVELSRLRWERDEQLGRAALTFDGVPAPIPLGLDEVSRTAVSFLLEEDRARALTLRFPIVDVRAALAQHVVAGGPAVASYRLDYLVAWAEAVTSGPVKPRLLEDEIESSPHAPGAHLTPRRSDAVHRALTDVRSHRLGSGGGPSAPARYVALVTEELEYKCGVLDRALDALGAFPDSRLRKVHRAIEADAQAVWRRRLSLHASDLVRFGRTYRHWRNSMVPVIESDRRCQRQLVSIANPHAADGMATDPGVREVAAATVVSTEPLVLDVRSRRIADGSRIVLLHINGDPCVEHPDVQVTHQKSSFKFAGLAMGPLTSAGDDLGPRRFTWTPANKPMLSVGDRLIVADFAWFLDRKTNLKGDKFLNVMRPAVDEVSAPKPDCTPNSYADSPTVHRYCCRPHEDAEAAWADQLAERRTRGELNPQVWPPAVDRDAFEVAPADAPADDAATEQATAPPDDLTLDDLE
jgi:hypothetical protein